MRRLRQKRVGRRIALLGAYDRFNYGDLLFPLIAARALAEHGISDEIAAFALTRSDLSTYGAMPTHGISSLFDGSFLSDGDVCIVNGGGVLGVDWIYAWSNTFGPLGNRVLQALERYCGQARLDAWVRARFRATSCAPFVLQPSGFKQQVKVAFNAVGGGAELLALPESRRAMLMQALAQSDFLSVRDIETEQALSEIPGVRLAPDSAVLMSRYFPLESLIGHSRPEIVDLVSSNHVCVQTYRDFGERHGAQLTTLTEGIFLATGYPALLLPIGRYPGLEDPAALAALSRRIRTPHRMFPADASIFEIMFAIARCRLFLGTSLHGQVTAQSFAVPHLGLDLSSPKLGAYLQTWELQPQSACVAVEDTRSAMAAIEAAMTLPRPVLQAKRDELMVRAAANFATLFAAVGLPIAA